MIAKQDTLGTPLFHNGVEHSKPLRPTPYHSILPGKRLHLRLMGQSFFDPEDRRHHGTVCHRVLSTIETADDISAAIQKHVHIGEISTDEGREIEEMLRTQLSEPEKQRWFKAGNRILNEQEILQPNRPDRIIIDNEGATVIDYKFGVERPTHRKQVAGYMHLLQEMGYTTRGYIWYVPTGKVITVET